jgi:multidrug efflux pump subunit AcrA (membrane-fusion protein)
MILKKFAEENEMVAAGTPIFLFGSSESDWIVKVGVTDRDIIKIQRGDSAWVFIDVFPSRKFKAVVTSVGSAANPMNGTYEVELSLNEKEPKFTSGFIAKTDIFPSAQTPFYIIPLEAIAQADEFSAEVYTVDDNSEAKIINVNIYRIFDENAALSSGLEDVQFIVTEGVNYLSEGAKVTIKEDKNSVFYEN